MIRKGIAFAILMFFVLVISANANTIYSGNLTINDGVFATAPWDDEFMIAWNHVQVGNVFDYTYEITNLTGGALSKDVSHFVFQVSDNFTLANLSGFTGGTVTPDSPKTFSGIFGIKVEDIPETGKVLINFQSDRMPMWGDFYVKDGNYRGHSVYATNVTGYQIGVPDTQVVPLPGTGMLLLTGFGMMYFVGVRKRDA